MRPPHYLCSLTLFCPSKQIFVPLSLNSFCGMAPGPRTLFEGLCISAIIAGVSMFSPLKYLPPIGPEWAVFPCLLCALMCGAAFWAQKKLSAHCDEQSQGSRPADHGERPAAFKRFQNQWLRVYLLTMLADWLQGTHMYTLYTSYEQPAGTLFAIGFSSSAVFGTFLGLFVDKYGRRLGCIVFCLLEIVINALEVIHQQLSLACSSHARRLWGGGGASMAAVDPTLYPQLAVPHTSASARKRAHTQAQARASQSKRKRTQAQAQAHSPNRTRPTACVHASARVHTSARKRASASARKRGKCKRTQARKRKRTHASARKRSASARTQAQAQAHARKRKRSASARQGKRHPSSTV